jgi:hypothetical protein
LIFDMCSAKAAAGRVFAIGLDFESKRTRVPLACTVLLAANHYNCDGDGVAGEHEHKLGDGLRAVPGCR